MHTSDGRPESPLSHATLDTPVGLIAVASTGEAIVRVEWLDAELSPEPTDELGSELTANLSPDPAPGQRWGSGSRAAEDPLLTEALAQLRAYFDGHLGEFDLPLSLDGISPTATRVLTTLAATVGYGTTVTYGQLAEASRTGIPARAIGTIMGLNPLPLIIPCHRVVAGDGLGGYSGGPRGQGLDTKRRLLEMEGALPSPLF